MYQLIIYALTLNLWRWEIRCGGALLRVGTARTKFAAERNARDAANA